MVKRRVYFGIGAAIVALGAVYLWRRHRVQSTLESAKESGGGMNWPCDSRNISCGFGVREAPVNGASTDHKGIDIAIAQGSAVYAVADGTIDASWDDQTYGGGYSLRIAHANGLTSHYCHLSKRLVAKGDIVKAGDPVALSGGTPGTEGAGTSTGAHLHFALKNNGIAFDPLSVLKA